MKIVFDARWTKFPRHDGISRYGANLLEALSQRVPVTALIYDKRQLDMLPKGPEYLLVNYPFSWRELWLPGRLNRLGADIVYSPMQIMSPFGRCYKLIFTLHDLIFYRHPEAPIYLSRLSQWLWRLYHRTYLPGRLVLNRADLLVTVSETVKAEILEARLTKRPIEVIYNATPVLPKPTGRPVVKRELVFMGTLHPYKNAELLIRTLPLLEGYRLQLPGRLTPDRLTALTALARQSGVEDRVKFWNGASDAEYATMLSTATAFVSASRDEGFGIPVIEAMASGVPAICSDIPVFHEVGGTAALYFNPDSPQELAARVHEVEDPQRRAELVKQGYTQAAAFSWEASAAKLLKVMERLVDRP